MPDREAPRCPWCDDKKSGVAVYGIRILKSCGMQCGLRKKAEYCPLCGRPLSENEKKEVGSGD